MKIWSECQNFKTSNEERYVHIIRKKFIYRPENKIKNITYESKNKKYKTYKS